MSVAQLDVIDWLGLEKHTGRVALTVVDDLDWSSEMEHLQLLQEKVNRYVASIESGEAERRLQETTGRSARPGAGFKISILARYPPTEEAERFLRHATHILESAGIQLEHAVLASHGLPVKRNGFPMVLSSGRKDSMTLADCLGAKMSELLAMPPFSEWKVTRSTEADLPTKEVWHEFEGHGVELICDESERVRTIFLHRGDGEALSGIAFSLSRRQVLERYGIPSKSGPPVQLPVLGERGAWDRFALPTATIHVQYRPDCDEIDMITLMRPDAAP